MNVTVKFFVTVRFKTPLYIKSNDPLGLNVGPLSIKFDGLTI
jgi:hypothetical protein